MNGQRERIEAELERIAFGENDLSGRTLAARVTALRRLEQITRPDDEGSTETTEERLQRLDFPCGPDGRFDPSGSAELWAINLAFRWRSGDARELQAIAHWEQRGGRRQWQLEGRPWPRSAWEQDRSPWSTRSARRPEGAAVIEAVIGGVQATLAEVSVPLPNGEVGYYQRSQFDCLKAAVATAVQVPYDDLPEIPNLGALHAWADAEGFTVNLHFPPDVPDRERRWIGVSPLLPAYGARHTVVGSYRDAYFDPSSGWRFERGWCAAPTPDLEFAISLERTA